MNASSRSTVRPHSRRPLKIVTGLLRKLSKSKLVDEEDTEKTQLQVENSSPEKGKNSIGAVMRNEKIETALSISNAVRQQRQQQSASSRSIMQDALLERLEAKLLTSQTECTELRKLAEARKRGIPVSLSSLNLGCDPEQDSCLGDSYLLKKLEALVLVKEEECTKARKLLVEAIKRGLPRTQKDTSRYSCLSLSNHLHSPKSVLRPPASPPTKKSVTWGTMMCV
jgi:hypothetical protein